MPEIAELPAPAEPAGGICAEAPDANGPADNNETAMAPASAEVRIIEGLQRLGMER